MISSIIYSTLALTQAGLALAAPGPRPTPVARSVLPRFLREAHMLPERGIMEDGVITMPVRRTKGQGRKTKRQNIVQVPIADDGGDEDYGIALDIGGQTLTFILDTGSSDLWAASKSCAGPSGESCVTDSSIPLYSTSSTFQNLSQPLILNYGTSIDRTYNDGTIGTDNVTLAGMTQSQQPFGVITTGNDPISFSGLFGVGFPFISNILGEAASAALNASTATQITGESFVSTYMQAMASSAPLLNRLADSGKLKSPMYTLTLQREIPTSVGSNAGVLTIGGLPSGISNDSLTWVPVRQYDSSLVLSSNLATPVNKPASPTLAKDIESIIPTLPFVWEAAIDGLYLEGTLLTNSSVNTTFTNQYGLSALFDSGTTDLLLTSNDIQTLQGLSQSGPNTPCALPLNLAIGIAGKQFPINPFDIWGPGGSSTSVNCTVSLDANDPPTVKSNLVAFYWGNLTDQASDPARIGFLSTTNAQEADSTFSSFWKSVGTTLSFQTANAVPTYTTINVANPVSAGAAAASAASGSSKSGAASVKMTGLGTTVAATVALSTVLSLL
ncbi:hypothetical protein HWV62_30165 [Athelia sp. TMB]|nr:hypothetical protein HWV62_30165 [Athelia sp. TMB]